MIMIVIILSSCTKKDTSASNNDSTPKKTLTVNVYPNGSGSIIKNPDQSDYQINTEVSLTANPKLGYLFSNWSGNASGLLNSVTVKMDSDRIVNANFEEGVNEDFNDGIADSFITDGPGRWHVTNGAYVMTGTNLKTTAYSYYPFSFFDFGFSVDLKVTKAGVDGHAVGIYFKSQSGDQANCYMVKIMKDGTWYFGKTVNSVFTFVTNGWIHSSNLNTGLNVTNNIKIISKGTQIAIYFNGIYEGTVTNATDFASGYAGVAGYDSDVNDNEFVFDNFKIVTTGIKSFTPANLNYTVDYDITKTEGIKRDANGKNNQ
jgi:hypothetical protein